jgi:two-component system sensor histidine kinase UhpB
MGMSSLVLAEAGQYVKPSVLTLGTQISQYTKILLIEDNPVDRQLVREALGDLSDRQLFGPTFDIKSADRLSTGLAYLAEGGIDVVLLDLSLPDSHGLEETFRLVRSKAPNVPVIVMTGLGDEALGLRIVREGAQDYLIKGQVERHLLIKAIRYSIERNHAEQVLRESEEKFRSIVEATNEWIWSCDLQGRLLYSNPASEVILGYQPEEMVGELTLSFVWPEDRKKLETQLDDSRLHGCGWSGLVLRWIHKDGSYKYLESNAVPMLDTHGFIIGYRGADRDITERQMARETRRQLQLRMVSVQEEERHRIARELHDQMGQSLAALMLKLKSLTMEKLEPAAVGRIKEVHDLANELARDVHHLALDLRPTALNDLGLHTALTNYVEEWAERWKVGIDLHTRGLESERLPAHIETTIYRIVQEALNNVLRHANSSQVSIVVEQRAGRVSAIVEDNGCGFDAEAMMNAPMKDRRLGLLGIQERIALVAGTFDIESSAGLGTTLYVHIPVSQGSGGH